MNENNFLTKAPIIEAILDIQVETPKLFKLNQFQEIWEKVKDQFPIKKERSNKQLKFSLKPMEQPKINLTHDEIDGYLFTTNDGKMSIQSRLDGFTFNMLKPYSHWEDFILKATTHWNDYKDLVKPSIIKSISLRFINRLEFPLPFIEFKEFILTVPEIAINLPQGLQKYYMQLVIPHPVFPMTAILTQILEEITSTHVPIIFDINIVYPFQNVPPDKIDFPEIFEMLRKYKNEIFFNSITEKTKGLYK